MSKTVGTILTVAAIAVGVASGVGLIAAGTAALISAGIAAATFANAAVMAAKAKEALQNRQASVAALQLGEVPREALFGQAMTGGSLVDAFNWGGKHGTDWECRIVALADHFCDALVGFYVNDVYVTYAGDGPVAGYKGQLEVYFRPGTMNQTVPPVVLTNGPGWTPNDIGAGVAWVAVCYKADKADEKNPVWPGGRPAFTWVLRGKRCYQARLDSTVGGSGAHRWADPSTWEWTDNPIDCRYNWVRGIYAGDQVSDVGMLLVGRGLTAVEAPPANVFARANICDEAVALDAGGTEKRYRANGVVRADETYITIEDHFAVACAGVLTQPEGAVEIEPGHAKSPVFFFSDDDLLTGSEVTFSDQLAESDEAWVNTVVPRYVDPTLKYADHAAPVRRLIADIVADGGPREQSLSLAMVTSATQAGRVGEIARRMGRLLGRGRVVLGPAFAEIEEGDWGIWTSQRYLKGGSMLVRVEGYAIDEKWHNTLVLREISATVYAKDADAASTSVAVQQSVGPIGAPAAGTWSLGKASLIQGDAIVPALAITGASDNDFAELLRFELLPAAGVSNPATSTDWREEGTGGPDVRRRVLSNVAPNTAYYAAVSYMVGRRPGPRLIVGPVTTDGQAVAWDAIAGTGKTELLQQVARISSDGWLDPSEKRQAKIDYDQRTAQRDALEAQWITLGKPSGVTSARNAAFAKVQDLYNYLQGLTPGWLDYTTMTQLLNPGDYQAAWKAAADALEGFAAAITGRPGASAYSVIVRNGAIQLPAEPDGTLQSYAGADFGFTVLNGTTDVTNAFSLVVTANPQNLSIPGAYPNYAIDAGFDASEPTARVDFELRGNGPHAGVNLPAGIMLTKSKSGVAGQPAPLITLTSNKAVATFNKADAYVGGAITFTAVRQHVPGPTMYRLIRSSDGVVLFADTAAGYAAFAPADWGGSSGDTLVASNVGGIIAAHGNFSIVAYKDGYATFDEVAIAKVKDGADGASGYTLLSTNPSHQVPADVNGSVTSYSGAGTTFKILYGTADVTSSFDASIAPGGNPQGLNFPGTYPTYAVVDGFDANEDVATYTFRLTGKPNTPHAGVVLDSVFSLSKSRAPANGVSPALITVSASEIAIRYDAAGNMVTGDVSITTARVNSSAIPVFDIVSGNGQVHGYQGTAAALTSSFPGTFDTTGPDVLILKPTWLNYVLQTFSPILRVTASLLGTPAKDTTALTKVQDGKNVPTISLSASSNVSKFDSAGNIVSGSIFYRASVANMPAGSEVIFAVHRPDGSLITEGTPAQLVGQSSAVWGSTDALSLEYKPAGQNDGLKNIANPLEFRARISGTAARSSQSLTILRDGNAAPAFNSVARGNATFIGSTIRKVGGGEGWDSDVFSTVGYLNGAVASGRFVAGRAMIGLNSDPGTNASHETIDFAIFAVADVGIIQIYRGPDYLGDFGSYNASDVLGVRYTGQFVEWFKNSEILLREDWGPGRTLYFDSSLLDPGTVINDVSFSSLSGQASGAFTLVPGTKTTTVGPNSITPTAWLDWGGNFAYSREAFLGGCSLTFDIPAHSGAGIMIGLRQGAPGPQGSASYEGVTFGWHRTSNANALTYAYINGKMVATGPDMMSAGRGRIDFDGRHVRWYTNDVLIFTRDWLGTVYDPYDPAQQLSFRCAFQGIEKPTNIAFTPRGRLGEKGQDGGQFSLSRYAVYLNATFDGVTKGGQLPAYTGVKYARGTTDLTSGLSVAVTPNVPAIEASYANGIVSVTRADSEGVVSVVGSYGGVEIGKLDLNIVRTRDQPPPPTTTRASGPVQMELAAVSSFYTYFSEILRLQAASNGQLYLTANFELSAHNGGSNPRLYRGGFIFAYRQTGATEWIGASSEFSGQSTSSGQYSDGEYAEGENAVIDMSATISGLTNGTSYDLVITGRKLSGNASGASCYGGMAVTSVNNNIS